MQGVRSVSRVTLDANVEGRCRLLEAQVGFLPASRPQNLPPGAVT